MHPPRAFAELHYDKSMIGAVRISPHQAADRQALLLACQANLDPGGGSGKCGDYAGGFEQYDAGVSGAAPGEGG